MRGHLQTGLHCLSGPWPPLLRQQPTTEHHNISPAAINVKNVSDVVLQNGKFGNGQRGGTPLVQAPHRQPQNLSNVDPLIQKRDWTPGSGHARTHRQHQYPLLHPQESGTPRESKGRDVRPNHMLHQARKIRRTKQDKISCGQRQSTLSRRRQDSHCQPTHC